MRRIIGFLTLFACLVGLFFLLACSKPKPIPVAPSTPVAEAKEDVPIPPVVARKRVNDVPLWTQTIAVLDVATKMTVPDTVTENIQQPITERVEAAFLQTGRFDLVERARLDSVKKELMGTSDSLWFDQTSVAKMGKFLGARYIILSTARMEVGVFSTRLDLLVKVLDTETASIVQTFDVRTASSSLSTNSSITACLDRIRLELVDAITPVYPAQAVIVHSPKDGIYWAEAKHTRGFRAGQKVRILQLADVFNPIKSTSSQFTVDAGRGRIQSVESFGLVIKAPGVKAEEGWLIEVLP